MKIDTPGLHRLRPDRHELLGSLPELPVDETRGEAAHPRECFRLSRPDFDGTRVQGTEGLLHQFVSGNHAAAALGNFGPWQAMGMAQKKFNFPRTTIARAKAAIKKHRAAKKKKPARDLKGQSEST